MIIGPKAPFMWSVCPIRPARNSVTRVTRKQVKSLVLGPEGIAVFLSDSSPRKQLVPRGLAKRNPLKRAVRLELPERFPNLIWPGALPLLILASLPRGVIVRMPGPLPWRRKWMLSTMA